MGRRCSKKAVRCGAIGVVLACASVDFSLAGPDRVFLLFAVRLMPAFPEQIVLHGRQCPASAPARLPDTKYVLQNILGNVTRNIYRHDLPCFITFLIRSQSG